MDCKNKFGGDMRIRTSLKLLAVQPLVSNTIPTILNKILTADFINLILCISPFNGSE